MADSFARKRKVLNWIAASSLMTLLEVMNIKVLFPRRRGPSNRANRIIKLDCRVRFNDLPRNDGGGGVTNRSYWFPTFAGMTMERMVCGIILFVTSRSLRRSNPV